MFANNHESMRSYGPRQANLVLIAYASSEGSGEPAHPRSLARTFAARSYKQWVKRNLQTENQIPGPSEWLGMRSWNLSWRNARRHKFAWRGSYYDCCFRAFWMPKCYICTNMNNFHKTMGRMSRNTVKSYWDSPLCFSKKEERMLKRKSNKEKGMEYRRIQCLKLSGIQTGIRKEVLKVIHIRFPIEISSCK